MKPAIWLVPLLWIGAVAQVRPLAQRPQFPQQQQTGKASVEGSVLDAVTSEPVKKASVMLNGLVSLNAVTDASGHFAFRQLPAGQYMIQVHSERYPQGLGLLDTAQALTISLAAEEQKQDIRLSLTPGASVRGHIVDEDGDPMPHCSVTGMQFRDMGTGRTLQQLGFSQSDDKGEYQISIFRAASITFRRAAISRCHCRTPSSAALPPWTYRRLPMRRSFTRERPIR